MDRCQSSEIIDVLGQAATLNRLDPLREGHLLKLPDYGQVIMTGDLHGCLENFRKLRRFADLDRNFHRHVLIHELIHTNGVLDLDGNHVQCEDASCMLLAQAAQWKMEFPEQVHFLLGNHDLAQMTSREVTKGGAASIANFNKWITDAFGETQGLAIIDAVRTFLFTLPLAAKSPNRLWMSHSLPGPYAMDNYDFSIFDREWTYQDMIPRGSVYETVWGRNHTPEQLPELADILKVDFFIVGHQRQEQGFDAPADRLLILASDHGQGCFLPIDLSRRFAFQDLIARVKFFCDLPAGSSQE